MNPHALPSDTKTVGTAQPGGDPSAGRMSERVHAPSRGTGRPAIPVARRMCGTTGPVPSENLEVSETGATHERGDQVRCVEFPLVQPESAQRWRLRDRARAP